MRSAHPTGVPGALARRGGQGRNAVEDGAAVARAAGPGRTAVRDGPRQCATPGRSPIVTVWKFAEARQVAGVMSG